MTRFEFELHGAEVAHRGVQTMTIVPAFDVLEDGRASLGTCGELRSGTLGFENFPPVAIKAELISGQFSTTSQNLAASLHYSAIAVVVKPGSISG
jgi:hypothetical protein